MGMMLGGELNIDFCTLRVFRFMVLDIFRTSFLPKIQNETFVRKRLRYGRALPSTPIAVASVVVMTDLLEKEEMTAIVAASFSSQNISPHRTKLGRDVVFRKGDPCNNHDLVRVAAHKAKHVVVMMTAKDEAEALANPGSASNSATTRTVLALRNIVYSHGKVLLLKEYILLMLLGMFV